MSAELREAILIHTMENGYEDVYSLKSKGNNLPDTYIHLKEVRDEALLGTIIYSPYSFLMDKEIEINSDNPYISNENRQSVKFKYTSYSDIGE